jgi:hypothetical protein
MLTSAQVFAHDNCRSLRAQYGALISQRDVLVGGEEEQGGGGKISTALDSIDSALAEVRDQIKNGCANKKVPAEATVCSGIQGSYKTSLARRDGLVERELRGESVGDFLDSVALRLGNLRALVQASGCVEP